MVLDYLNHDFGSLFTKLYVAFFTWLIVLIGIGIDLFHGTKKSKAIGEYIHSYGLRQTVQKVINYLSMMLFMLLFDSINPLGQFLEVFRVLPMASIIGALVLTWIEFKSVREKADEKFRRKTTKATREILEIITSDENALHKIAEKFKKTDNEETNAGQQKETL